MSEQRRLTFRDTDEGAEMFAFVFGAYNRSPYETADDEELRRAHRIKDARDLVSEEAGGDARFRKLVRGKGDQQLVLSNSEYELLKKVIRSTRWPPADADIALRVRGFINEAMIIEDERVDG